MVRDRDEVDAEGTMRFGSAKICTANQEPRRAVAGSAQDIYRRPQPSNVVKRVVNWRSLHFG
jgi:hypothetical protein